MKVSVLSAVIASSLCAFSVAAQQLSGVVVDTQGNLIKNAKISINKGQQVAVTDENGRFVIQDIGDRAVELHVRARNFQHANKQLAFPLKSDDISITLEESAIETLDVFATPLHASNIESALPINVIANEELKNKHSSTLGETLKNEVGVHSSYYGPIASSPIIRGLDGPRVLVVQNGLDVSDASRVGPDHVVTSETASSQQVEVLRGPATLFYGSGAIGGVVNVVDNRVPQSIENKLDYSLSHNDVADEDEASFALNTGKDNLAFYLDGFWRESNDVDIPGFADIHDEEGHHDEHEEDHHDEHEGEEHHDEHEEEPVFGKIENSASKSHGFTIGSSYLLDNGFVGVSFGRLEKTYGIPGHSHDHGHEEHEGEEHEGEEHEEHSEESVMGDLKQDRFQLLSDLYFNDQFINRVASKLAYTDYSHVEIENGAVGTEFANEMLETRFDLYHQEYNGWKGAWTVHYKENDFSAVGAEAFTPPSTTSSFAFAWLEEKHFDDVLVQLGVRVEHIEIETEIEMHEEHEEEHHDEHEGEEHHEEHEEHHMVEKESFTPVSVSAGLVWDYQPGYNLGFSAALSQRAPSAAETYSNGPHIGTNTYEVGVNYTIEPHGDHHDIEYTPGVADIETSFNLDVTWRKFGGDFGFVVSAFYNQVDDYYFAQNTGIFMESGHDHHEEEHHEDEHHEDEHHEDEHEEEAGLPVYQFVQEDVVLYGFEAEAVYKWRDDFKTSVFADMTKAKIDGGDDLPRVPPARLGVEFDYQHDVFGAQLSAVRYFDQKDISKYETETDGYTMVDLNFNYYMNGFGDETVLFLKAVNLLDEEARIHQSFLKDVAPLPGRAFKVGIRGTF